MSLADYLVLGGILLLVAAALFWWRRRRKAGKGGCGQSCAGCPHAGQCSRQPNNGPPNGR